VMEGPPGEVGVQHATDTVLAALPFVLAVGSRRRDPPPGKVPTAGPTQLPAQTRSAH